MKLIKLLPNILTIFNGLCGVLALVFIVDYVDYSFPKEISYFIAFLLILTASVLDFFDGFVARKINHTSKMGSQLDSFSDLISFALAPSFLVFDIMQNSDRFMEVNLSDGSLLPYLSFLIIPTAMYRLARFNNSINSENFTGLPTPAVGIFFMGLPFLPFKLTFIILISLILIFSFLMVSSLNFYSLKPSVTKNRRFLLAFVFVELILLITLIITKTDLINFFSISVLMYISLNLLFVSLSKYFNQFCSHYLYLYFLYLQQKNTQKHSYFRRYLLS